MRSKSFKWSHKISWEHTTTFQYFEIGSDNILVVASCIASFAQWRRVSMCVCVYVQIQARNIAQKLHFNVIMPKHIQNSLTILCTTVLVLNSSLFDLQFCSKSTFFVGKNNIALFLQIYFDFCWDGVVNRESSYSSLFGVRTSN